MGDGLDGYVRAVRVESKVIGKVEDFEAVSSPPDEPEAGRVTYVSRQRGRKERILISFGLANSFLK